MHELWRVSLGSSGPTPFYLDGLALPTSVDLVGATDCRTSAIKSPRGSSERSRPDINSLQNHRTIVSTTLLLSAVTPDQDRNLADEGRIRCPAHRKQ
jgi:hypothetical protein